MESLGRALAVEPAVAYWQRLKALYQSPRNPGDSLRPDAVLGKEARALLAK